MARIPIEAQYSMTNGADAFVRPVFCEKRELIN